MNIVSSSGTLAKNKSSKIINSSGELAVMQKFIIDGSVVFDVGAHTGAWTDELLNIQPDVTVHLFEPVPQNYHALLRNLAGPLGKGKLRPNSCALTDREEIRLFHHYEDAPTLSTFHRRLTVEKEQNLKEPVAYPVFTTTLDNYCRSSNITRINFLKIDVEGAELEVLSGAKESLKKGRIDFLQFEYGGTFLDAGITLERVFEYLQRFRYSLFKIFKDGLEYMPQVLPGYENFSFSNFLAVNERFLPSVLGKTPKMLDLQELCQRHGITPRGVIHIGAHEGGELPKYRAMGIQRVLFIEANPAVFARLEEKVGSESGVDLVNCAISDHDGTTVLHVTSMDQSSSILPLKGHKDIYPDIAETGKIIVPARRLDSLLQELGVAPADFNLLNIDIQGAELLAFKGAASTLPFIEAINTEVNYAELYSGCAIIDELDDFLEAPGFERKATITPYHHSWGDAFYIKKPVVTISCLGNFGRFANQIFQYAFVKTYARNHDLRVETPSWIGQYLFERNDPPISRQLPLIEDLCNVLPQATIPNQTETYKNVDFRGFFQYHTRYYAPHKDYFRSLFKPAMGLEARLHEGVKCLRSRGKTVVGLHLRRGDYGYDIFYIAPSEWYREWLKGFWDTLDQPVLYIASDEPDKVLADFAEYNPVTARDLGVSIPEAPYYTDFYILSQCDAVAISNSSFSFAACMLNESATYFFRPHLPFQKLIPFDPWNSEIILRDATVESQREKASINERQLSQTCIIPLTHSISELDRIIPPEIKDDEFYFSIQKLAREEKFKTVLEIGSSAGGGSTDAFVSGLRENPNKPKLYCMEVSKTRFAELQKRYANEPFVQCYNVSSVPRDKFPSSEQVTSFYHSTQTVLNSYPLLTVLGWLEQDLEYIEKAAVAANGIEIIKRENNILCFDMVLIDGSEFTGNAEFEQIYGARIIFLDDINSFKNFNNYQRLSADSNYVLISENWKVRNGYAIFRKIESHLPVHFFTIVLNGEPFIRHHIEIFRQLPFKWHWHIVEGVADLKHDTAWSTHLGGRITDTFHRNGLSNDGTTEYIDELERRFPANVTVYRKTNGAFWDGKLEMVNAPLANIKEECLLWQVDADELWTVDQICKARRMFIDNPGKTAAFYWCWFFVGRDLVISTRYCYAQNPQQEWLRTWLYKPGHVWASHEPPQLARLSRDGNWIDVASENPFTHAETEKQGLVFQHFAYATLSQLRFKESYYGYKNAVFLWLTLQKETCFPVYLRNFFPWVHDETMVNTAQSCGFVPLTWPDKQFRDKTPLIVSSSNNATASPLIIVDGMFFQFYKTGIARLWVSLLMQWARTGFAKHILVLDRAETAPRIRGLRYRNVPAYDYADTDADRQMLQQVCDEEGGDLFISTYYTTPLSTPSVFMAYDMIPEVLGADLTNPMWVEKHRGIHHAKKFIAISHSTAHDLVKFFHHLSPQDITVAHCGVDPAFSPATATEIEHFKIKYGIRKPYFLHVGSLGGYKNTGIFFEALTKSHLMKDFEIVCTGKFSSFDDGYAEIMEESFVHALQGLDDSELRLAYSGAVALVYPSLYEGFGLPVVEAMACGCPVITCHKSSLPEVAGDAAIYVSESDVDELCKAMSEISKNDVRQPLIEAGLQQAKKFTWQKMAHIVMSALLKSLELHNELGVMLLEQGDLEEAEKAFMEAILLNPVCADTYYNLGTLMGKQEKYKEAAYMYRKALALNPDFTKAHHRLDDALGRIGNRENAPQSYQQAALAALS